MIIPIIVLAFILSACTGPQGTVKPITPTEVQLITQVISKRIILPKVKEGQKEQLIRGLNASMDALETMSPVLVLSELPELLGPENADIAELIQVLVKERVDLAVLPEIEGKAYVFAVLAGVEGGLK